MERVSVSALKSRLSHYLRLVRRGQGVVVMDRGQPIAQLTRLAPEEARPDDQVLAGLELRGIVTMPQTRHLSKEVFDRLPACRTSAAATVVSERENGR